MLLLQFRVVTHYLKPTSDMDRNNVKTLEKHDRYSIRYV